MQQKFNRKDQVFETMVKPTSDETYKYLKGYRPPSTAFILFEKIEFKIVGDGAYDYGTGLHTLNVEHRPEQTSKVEYYLRKGYKVLHYANFPGVHERDSMSMAQAQLYSGENRKNPWEELSQFLDSKIKDNPHWRSEMTEKDDKIATLEKEMERMRARLEKTDKKGGADKAVTE